MTRVARSAWLPVERTIACGAPAAAGPLSYGLFVVVRRVLAVHGASMRRRSDSSLAAADGAVRPGALHFMSSATGQTAASRR